MWIYEVLHLRYRISTKTLINGNFEIFVGLSIRKGKGSKTRVTENVRDGGGSTPLFRDFFSLTFWPAAFRDGGGRVPPFSVMKKSVENWPKNSYF